MTGELGSLAAETASNISKAIDAAKLQVSPAVQQQIDQARQVLFELDSNGDIIDKSQRYKRYIEFADAHAQAVADYDEFRAQCLADPQCAGRFPIRSRPYKRKVDQAYDDWKTQGRVAEIEAALKTLNSVGVSIPHSHPITE